MQNRQGWEHDRRIILPMLLGAEFFANSWLNSKIHSFFWLQCVNTIVNDDGFYDPSASPFPSDEAANPLNPFTWMLEI
jgi:hypothetical protein